MANNEVLKAKRSLEMIVEREIIKLVKKLGLKRVNI